MTQEEKKLLLKDLCAKFPYKVKCLYRYEHLYDDEESEGVGILTCVKFESSYIEIDEEKYYLEKCKPYLRPMSTMTQDECTQLSMLLPESYVVYPEQIHNINELTKILPEHIEIITDFYNSHYLDWRGLIPKGLALEATENMYLKELKHK